MSQKSDIEWVSIVTLYESKHWFFMSKYSDSLWVKILILYESI